MYSRTGITVYRRGAAISRSWRLSEIVAKTTSASACAHHRRTTSSSSSSSSSSALDAVFPRHENFARRHIGPNDQEQAAMLEFLELKVRARFRFGLSAYSSIDVNNRLARSFRLAQLGSAQHSALGVGREVTCK